MNPENVAVFLTGCLVGASGVLALTGLALWLLGWRQAWRDGMELRGEELERAKRREP